MRVGRPAAQKTVSEALFEEFCRLLAIPFEPIPVEEAEKPDDRPRTPDYEIHPNGHRVVVEVKQINANEDDKRAERELESVGHADIAPKASPRVRKKIADAAPQLKRRAKGICPALLVLYDNASPVGNFYTDPYTIKAAMFGHEQVVLSVPQDFSAPVGVHDRKFGPKRKMTPHDNTTISAVAVMIADRCRPRELLVYHNPFAAIPLPADWLRAEMVRHFNLTGKRALQFQHWVQVRGGREVNDPLPGTRESFECVLGELVVALENRLLDSSLDKTVHAQTLLRRAHQEFAAAKDRWEADIREDIARFLDEARLELNADEGSERNRAR
jgi:hypothetical protein